MKSYDLLSFLVLFNTILTFYYVKNSIILTLGIIISMTLFLVPRTISKIAEK